MLALIIDGVYDVIKHKNNKNIIVINNLFLVLNFFKSLFIILANIDTCSPDNANK